MDVNRDLVKYSALSGMAEVTLTHPLDVIKTLRQQKTPLPNPSFRAFYSGFQPKVLGTVPMRTVFWTSQFGFSRLFTRWEMPQPLLFSGIAAGVAQTVIDTPADYFKINAINRRLAGSGTTSAPTPSTRAPVFDLRNMYRGFMVNALRNGIFASSVNIWIHQVVRRNAGTSPGDQRLEWVKRFAYPALGGVIGALVTQPLDYAKTVKQNGSLQADWPTMKILLYPANAPYLMRGAVPRACMAFCNMGVGGCMMAWLLSRKNDRQH